MQPEYRDQNLRPGTRLRTTQVTWGLAVGTTLTLDRDLGFRVNTQHWVLSSP